MQSQSVNRISKTIIRRSRAPLSCEACRSRKLKCSRDKPCQNCSVRGEQAACVYKGSTNDGASLVHGDKNGIGEPMRQRIDQLEQMVKRLVGQGPPRGQEAQSQSYGLGLGQGGIPGKEVAAGPTPSPDGSLGGYGSGSVSVSVDSFGSGAGGVTVIDGGHSVYKPTEDWYDVLQEVNELKRTWDETQDVEDVQPSLSNSVDGTSLLFGQVERVDIVDILSSLPPRDEMSRLIAWFFDRPNFPLSIPPIVHEQTFKNELAKHWEDPSQTTVIWIGLLFSILGITMVACQFGQLPEYEGNSESLFHLYRLRTAQCLQIGDIAKCLPYTVETLRFNATAELNRKDDNGRGLWIMTGVVVRAAVNMGYHRDPDHTPSLSPLEAEFRRRVWLSVVNMDEVASFMSGFPRMIPAMNADTKEPRNLQDWQLTSETIILPESRPLSEPTPASYLIFKGRLFHALGEIIDFLSGPYSDNYNRMIEIDQYLHNTYHNLPAHMHIDPRQITSDSLKTASDYSNLQLNLMYHHGVCTLHRNSIRKDHRDHTWDQPRSQCIRSALSLVDFQALLKPSWYTFSRTRQMLARATMTLLFELESRRQSPSDLEPDIPTETLLHAFQRSVSLWRDASGVCEEAGKLSRVLNKMLRSYEPAEPAEPVGMSLDSGLGSGSGSGSVSFEDALLDIPDGRSIDWAWWDEFVEGSSLVYS
ncbi:hypothetical protein BJX70DRAFT_30374 [Aspergillus crustosus]